MGDREVSMFKAPQLAMSGRYKTADEIIAVLAHEVRKVHMAFPPAVREHLDDLCRAHWKPKDKFRLSANRRRWQACGVASM